MLGDGIEYMRNIADNSVDFVFADPPYNKGKEYGEEVDDDLPDDEYRALMAMAVEQAMRVSGGKVAFYVGGTLTRLFFELLPDAHLIVVHKRAVGIMAGNFILQYHSLFITAPPLEKTTDLWEDIRLPGEGYFYKEKRYGHPGETPLKLIKRVLMKFTQPYDMVLDPFSGTGTTAIACQQMRRRHLGIEKVERWHRVALSRLKESRLQMELGL